MLMRLMSKGEYLIVPKGTKFTGSGKLGLIRFKENPWPLQPKNIIPEAYKHCVCEVTLIWITMMALCSIFSNIIHILYNITTIKVLSWYKLTVNSKTTGSVKLVRSSAPVTMADMISPPTTRVSLVELVGNKVSVLWTTKLTPIEAENNVT